MYKPQLPCMSKALEEKLSDHGGIACSWKWWLIWKVKAKKIGIIKIINKMTLNILKDCWK